MEVSGFGMLLIPVFWIRHFCISILWLFFFNIHDYYYTTKNIPLLYPHSCANFVCTQQWSYNARELQVALYYLAPAYELLITPNPFFNTTLILVIKKLYNAIVVLIPATSVNSFTAS